MIHGENLFIEDLQYKMIKGGKIITKNLRTNWSKRFSFRATRKSR